MAGLVNCPRCGAVFTKDRHDICKNCLEKENDQLNLLKKYLDENPGAQLKELVRVSGVPEETIVHYVRTNRLISVMETPALKIYCEECGAEIITGRFCRKCREKIASRFETAASSLKPKRD